MPHTEDGKSVDIIFSADSVLKRMNIGQTFEVPLGMAGRVLNKKYTIPVLTQLEEQKIFDELKEAGLDVSGKVKLIDGRTGDYFDQEIIMGEGYVFKLHHMAEEKITARSIGPYNLITQQPQHGKQNMGGQRLGEMEVWAIESYGAAKLLQEMLTIKSDDIYGRVKAYNAILNGEEIPEGHIPESFKLLLRELNGLGLGLEPIGAERSEDVPAPIISKAEEATEIFSTEDEAEDNEDIEGEKE
jgi:DNA-directed RNA polymerase subunit beta